MTSVADKLLDSSRQLSYDPTVEVDWETPLDKNMWGMSPEWCSLYGTGYWKELGEEKQKEISRLESACVATAGIWFELILQQMMLRDIYTTSRSSAEFQWALTEIADECRHSIMFARGAAKSDAPPFVPKRHILELGRAYKTLATGESAYAAILVAEEILDVMQRDWMRDERVLPFIRTINNIHVVEESRHMKFARDEVRKHMAGAGNLRRHSSALVVALTAYFILEAMFSNDVYKAAQIDVQRATWEAKHNVHHHAMITSSCKGLVAFLDEVGLLTGPAKAIYRKAHII